MGRSDAERRAMFAAMLGGTLSRPGPRFRKRAVAKAKPKVRSVTVGAQDAQRLMQEQAIQQHAGLVGTIARRYARVHPTADVADLEQEGRMGLLDAVKNYKARPNAKFATFAVFHIRNRVKRAAEASHMMRVPERTLRKKLKAGEHLPNVYSGEERVGAEDDAPTVLEREHAPTEGFGSMGQAHARVSLLKLKPRLKPIEWRVLELRYMRDWPLRKVARAIGKSTTRTFKIEARAKARAQALEVGL